MFLQNFRAVFAFRQQQQPQGEIWPPGGWPPPPPPGPLPAASTPELEAQPHKPPIPPDYRNHWHPDVYRQFATRYDPKPVDHAYLLHPENRASYEEFMANHPRHPTYPNSVDRSAQSLVCLVFALVGLMLIFFVLIVIDRLQAQHLSSKSITFGALTLVFAPWLLLWTWVLLVLVSNAAEPTRGHGDQYHWACPLMLVYLGIFLFVHTVNVIVQAYAEWHTLFPKVEGKMGQMFHAIEGRIDKVEASHPTWVKPVRITFFALDVLVALLGMWLVFFSGPHRDFCQPTLWWTSAFIAAVMGAAFLALAATYGCWRVVKVLAAKSTGKDYLAFFHVLYYGESANLHPELIDPKFVPASEPVIETKPMQLQTRPTEASPERNVAQKLQHAATQQFAPATRRPQLQHAQTTTFSGGRAGQVQTVGRI